MHVLMARMFATIVENRKGSQQPQAYGYVRLRIHADLNRDIARSGLSVFASVGRQEMAITLPTPTATIRSDSWTLRRFEHAGKFEVGHGSPPYPSGANRFVADAYIIQ